MTHTFTLEQHVPAPPDAIYYAFTNSPTLGEWFCDWAVLTPVRAQTLYLYWDSGFQAMGRYTELEPGKRIVFTWNDGASPECRAEVTLTLSGDGTTVRMTYHDVDNENQAQQLEIHWKAGLENLASFFDTGIDLRIARRPMLGVWLGDLVNEKTAERYGTPHGITLEGVLAEMSAEAAGLQSGDVLVEINERTLNDYGDLNHAIAGKPVGESVNVMYMRDGERQTATMTLKSRPIPDIPLDPDALADRMAAIYSEFNAELDALVAEMTEEQADIVPVDDEWSPRQILAHLTANERDTHTRISMRAGGFGEAFSFYNNSLTRIAPIIATYPTIGELVAELKRCEAQTVAVIRNLPEAFVRRRGSYFKLGWELVEEQQTHPRDHMAQIRRALGE